MSIQSAFTQSGIFFPAKYNNGKEKVIAGIKEFPGGERFVVCPWCGKKNLKVLPETKIRMMPYKCKASKCRREFIIDAL